MTAGLLAVSLMPAPRRAFHGRPARLKKRLRDLETGQLGEAIAAAWLTHERSPALKTVVKAGGGHFAFDLLAVPFAIEVKAGLASNSTGAQVWRLTQGRPCDDERAWLASADADAKADHNQRKQYAIHDRKQAALNAMALAAKTHLSALTVTCILDPDHTLVDVFEFQGLHDRIAWTSAEATIGYRGSYLYLLKG